MTSKFKFGEQVLCIDADSDGCLEVGKTYTVVRCSGVHIFLSGENYGWKMERFIQAPNNVSTIKEEDMSTFIGALQI